MGNSSSGPSGPESNWQFEQIQLEGSKMDYAGKSGGPYSASVKASRATQESIQVPPRLMQAGADPRVAKKEPEGSLKYLKMAQITQNRNQTTVWVPKLTLYPGFRRLMPF